LEGLSEAGGRLLAVFGRELVSFEGYWIKTFGFVRRFLYQYGDMEGGYLRSGFLLPELRNEPAIHSAGLTGDLVGV